MKCNNRCYRLLTVSRNRIHSHVDRACAFSFHISLCVFWFNQWMLGWSFFFFFCLRWINGTSALFTTSSSQEIRKYFKFAMSLTWDNPTLYQSSADLVLCGRISKHCAKSRPWQGEMGSVTAKCSKEAAFGAGIGLLVLIAVWWCWCNRFLFGGGGCVLLKYFKTSLTHFIFFFFWLWQF